MKVLVTGAAGFIGFHVSKALLEQGDIVIGIDNFNKYYSVELKQARADELLKDKNFVLIKADISDYDAMEKAFAEHKPDRVCHLAAQAGVRYSLEDPFAYEKTNVKGFLNILELCREHEIRYLIYGSSSSVYGLNDKMPFAEDDCVKRPASLYAATKKSNEEMAHVYHHLYGINCFGLRFFTVYGPWGRPDMALFKFTEKMLAGEPIDIYNKGDMARDFTFISDITQGVIAAIGRCAGNEVINLARGESVKLMKYVEELERSLGIEAKKNMMEMQPGDVKETAASIEKARKVLGYDPQIGVEEGVNSFVTWYKNFYGIK